MQKLVKKVSKKAGLSPGTLIHVGEKKEGDTKISIIDYDQKNLSEKQAKRIEETFRLKSKPTVTWINIDGLHNTDMIEKIGKEFDKKGIEISWPIRKLYFTKKKID